MVSMRTWIFGWLAAALVCILLTLFSAQRVAAATAPAVVSDSILTTSPVANSIRFLSGSTAQISSPERSTVIFGASDLSQTAPVAGDVVGAGSSIRLLAPVVGDVYVAGSSVRISGEVYGNVVVAGSEISIDPEAIIHGSLLLAGERVRVDGQVWGQTRVWSNNVLLGGDLRDSTQVHARKLEILETANLNTLQARVKLIEESPLASFSGTSEIEIVDSQSGLGQPVQTRPALSPWKVVRTAVLSSLFALTVWFLTRSHWTQWQRLVRQNLGQIVLLGSSVGLFWPVLALLCLISVIAIPLALLGTTAWLLFLWGGWVLVVLVLAHSFSADQVRLPHWLQVVVWGLVWGAVMALPTLGWVVRLLSGLMGLGIFVQAIWNVLRPHTAPLGGASSPSASRKSKKSRT